MDLLSMFRFQIYVIIFKLKPFLINTDTFMKFHHSGILLSAPWSITTPSEIHSTGLTKTSIAVAGIPQRCLHNRVINRRLKKKKKNNVDKKDTFKNTTNKTSNVDGSAIRP